MMTQVQASSLAIGEALIAQGQLSLTVCDSLNNPLPFRCGETVYGLEPFVTSITNGAIAPGFLVPDLASVVPLKENATAAYRIVVLDAAHRESFTILNVSEITGPLWSLDSYTPSSSASVAPSAFSSGTGAPTAHTGIQPALYLRLDTEHLYASFAGSWIDIGPFTSSGSSDQVSGTFTESVSEMMGVCALPGGYGTAKSTDSTRPVVGIASSGVTAGSIGSLQTAGELELVSWSWTLGQPIFIGPTGTLTQTAPLSGYTQVVGYPTSPTSMLVEIDPPIYLG